MCREEGSLAGPDGFDKWADPKATFRLHEGISNPSRAEDLPHLHRLQKSSTKPRSGALLLLCRCFLLSSSHWLQRLCILPCNTGCRKCGPRTAGLIVRDPALFSTIVRASSKRSYNYLCISCMLVCKSLKEVRGRQLMGLL